MLTRKISIETDADNVLIGHKFTNKQFFWRELSGFITQVFVFSWVAYLTANAFSDPLALYGYFEAKVQAGVVKELVNITIATFITIGFLSTISKINVGNSTFTILINESLLSVARTVYVLGSSILGSSFSITIFNLIQGTDKLNISSNLFKYALFVGGGAFLLGFLISRFLSKGLIRNNKKPSWYNLP